jgi:AraC-like DNA-binding protein
MSLCYRSTSLPGLEALSCRSSFSFGDHLHSGHVIWLNSLGGEHFSVKGSSTILQPGSVSIIEAGVIHNNRPCSGGPRYLRSLYLEEAFFVDLGEKLELRHSPMLTSRVVTDPVLWRGMAALHETIMRGDDDFAIENTMLTVFGRLLASCGVAGQGGEAADQGPRLQRAADYLREHLDEQVTLESLAAIADCSVGHLIRLFRQNVGMTPHGYLTQLRLERARILIAEGLALPDVAYRSGFADQSHLTRKFRKRYGITPGAYAKT